MDFASHEEDRVGRMELNRVFSTLQTRLRSVHIPKKDEPTTIGVVGSVQTHQQAHTLQCAMDPRAVRGTLPVASIAHSGYNVEEYPRS
jgi:hypothetical protein